MAATPRPLLLVLAHGMRAEDLGGLTAAEPAAATPIAITDVPADPERALLSVGDASAALWDMGIAVDRSALSLRPRGRSDTTLLENLRRRPLGPAPVTLLATSFVADLGCADGGNRNHAIAEVDAFMHNARTILRAGDAPSVWLLACGGLERTSYTFDFAGHWERQLAWPWRRALRATVQPHQVTIRAADQHALDHTADLLQRAPFRGRGTLSLPHAGELHFTACRGVAFGRSAIHSRTNTRATAAALVPATGERLPPTLSFAQWLARFWLHAQALHAPELRQGAAAGTRAPAASAAATAVGNSRARPRY